VIDRPGPAAGGRAGPGRAGPGRARRAAGAAGRGVSRAGSARPLAAVRSSTRIFREPAAEISLDDGAGLILGVITWIVAIQYLEGGMSQVQKWLRAKFLNYEGGRKPA